MQRPDGETSWIYNREGERERAQAQLLPLSSLDGLGSSAAPEVGAAVMSSRQMPGNIWRADAAKSHTVRRKVREIGSGAFTARSRCQSCPTLGAKVTLLYSAVST